MGVMAKGVGVAEVVGKGYVWDEWGLWRGVVGEGGVGVGGNVAPAQHENAAPTLALEPGGKDDGKIPPKKKKSSLASTPAKMRSTPPFTPPPTPRKGDGKTGVTICDYRTPRQKRDEARDMNWGW